MATTTPASSLSRYRPIVLTITGLAASYSLYLLYTTLRAPAGPGLRRSNAVSRREGSSTRHLQRLAESVEQTAQEDVPEAVRYLRASLNRITEYSFGVHSVLVAGQRHEFPLTASRLYRMNVFLGLELHVPPDQVPGLVLECHDIFLDGFLADGLGVRCTARLPVVGAVEIVRWLRQEVGIHHEQFQRAVRRLYEAHIDEWPADIPPPLPLSQIGDDEERLLDPFTAQQDGAETIAGTEFSYYTPEVGAFTAGVRTRQAIEGQDLKSILFYIAEDQGRQEGYVHRGVSCDGCDTKPIRGVRWRCMNCADFDLCSECESRGMHPKTHIFYKVKIPAPFLGNPRMAQPVIYPGNPTLFRHTLPRDVRKQMIDALKFSDAEVDGLWDQFTCLADKPWHLDPNKLGAAISRRAFDKAFIPFTSVNPPRPNLIYDRMFAFYDSNQDGLIGFEEFLRGLATQQSRIDGTTRWRKVFEGYDMDRDGFVSRKDFLRMFRAFYAIQKEITRDLLASEEHEMSVAFQMERHIRSSQPLSAAFHGSSFGSGSRRRRKPLDEYGDPLEPEGGVVAEDNDDYGNRADIISQFSPAPDDFQRRGTRNFADEISQQILQDRWRRRGFYTDEEEGLNAPDEFEEDEDEGYEDTNELDQGDDNSPGAPSPALEGTSNARSRSSSKVRFQDDLDDARSNASTSSRPVGERWGGYEIPEAEKDFGQDVLYQVTQQGLNELLDPFFKEKEDLGLEVSRSARERKRHRSLIMPEVEKRRPPLIDPLLEQAASADPEMADAARQAARTQLQAFVAENPGARAPSEIVAEVGQYVFRFSPQDLEGEIERVEEGVAMANVGDLLRNLDMEITIEEEVSREEQVVEDREEENSIFEDVDQDWDQTITLPSQAMGTEPESPDPTMPQNRPNSTVPGSSASATGDYTIPHSPPTASPISGDFESPPNATATSLSPPKLKGKALLEPPSPERLEKLIELELAAIEIRRRGGAGRLNFAEFTQLVRTPERELGFVEGWLELGSF